MTDRMTEPRMKVSIATDGRAVLELLPASGLQGNVPLNLDQLSTLILRLGQARATMLAHAPPPPVEGVPLTPVYGTSWAVQPEAVTEGSVLAFQHPAFGPVAFALPPADLERLIRALSTHLGMIHTGDQPRQVS